MKAVIFDFDGVVIDSQYHWDEHSPMHLQKILPQWTREHSPLLKGHNNTGCYKILTEQFGLSIPLAEFDQHVHRFAHHIYHHAAAPTAGVLDLLRRLETLVPKPSIASAGHLNWIEVAMARLHLRPHFNHITTSEEVAHSKPEPDVYLKAAEKISRAPIDCVAIEDTDAGGASAKAAGMTVIGFHPAGQDWQDIATADIHIASFDELTGERLRSLLEQ